MTMLLNMLSSDEHIFIPGLFHVFCMSGSEASNLTVQKGWWGGKRAEK